MILQLFNSAMQTIGAKLSSTDPDEEWYQQTVVTSIQAFPYVSITKLDENWSPYTRYRMPGERNHLSATRLNC